MARRDPTVIARPHGREVVNDYEWLRNRDDPAVIEYLQAETAYAEAVQAEARDLRDDLVAEILARRAAGDGPAGPPLVRGRYRFTRRRGGRDFPVVDRVDSIRPDAEAVPVLDLDEIGRGHPYLDFDALAPSDDGEYLAYSVDVLGNERYALSIVDLRTGRTVVSGLAKAEWVTWAGTDTLFYVEVAEAPWRGQKLWRIDLPDGIRTLVFEESDRSLSLRARRSSDGQYVILDVLQKWSGAPTSAVEVHVCPADRPREPWRRVLLRSAGREAHFDTLAGRVYARLDDHGPDCRFVRSTSSAPALDDDAVEELLPHRPGIALDHVLMFPDHAVIGEREDGQLHLRVLELATGASGRLPLPEPSCSIDPDPAGSRFRDGVLRYRYSSFVTPPTVVDLDLATGETTMVWQQPVSGYDAARYEVIRTVAAAADGTPVPVILLRARDAAQPAPTILHGYGCYGYASPPEFSANRFSLVDRGASWAVALVRGGGDFGRRGHDAGRQFNKRNTFIDFIAAAEHLVAVGLADRDRLAINGASAGGTLVLAAANMRPDLFRAVRAGVPFADPLHVQLDESMPFTVLERAEWGDPYRSEREFEYLASYCPFSNLEPQAYPAMFVTAALHDGQVPYWQPAKYVARLRALKTDDRTLLLRTDFEGGHQGPTRPDRAGRAVADAWAFLIRELELPAHPAARAGTPAGATSAPSTDTSPG